MRFLTFNRLGASLSSVLALAACSALPQNSNAGPTDRVAVAEESMAVVADESVPAAALAPRVVLEELQIVGPNRSVSALRTARFELAYSDVDAKTLSVEFVDPTGTVYERRQLGVGLVQGVEGHALVELDVRGTFVQQGNLVGAWKLNAYADSGALLASRTFEVLP